MQCTHTHICMYVSISLLYNTYHGLLTAHYMHTPCKPHNTYYYCLYNTFYYSLKILAHALLTTHYLLCNLLQCSSKSPLHQHPVFEVCALEEDDQKLVLVAVHAQLEKLGCVCVRESVCGCGCVCLCVDVCCICGSGCRCGCWCGWVWGCGGVGVWGCGYGCGCGRCMYVGACLRGVCVCMCVCACWILKLHACMRIAPTILTMHTLIAPTTHVCMHL